MDKYDGPFSLRVRAAGSVYNGIVSSPIMVPRGLVVKHIDLNAHGEAVKQFFLSLPVDPEGSVVELNGQAVARVTPINGQRKAFLKPWGPGPSAKKPVGAL